MQLDHLYQEIARLREENTLLKRQLGLSDVDVIPDNAEITMQSPTVKKISLFRSLFRGRQDVYAKRWYSEKLGRGGYSPACSNEWRKGVCNKSRWKCKDCPHRMLTLLQDAAIYAHLGGKDPLGRDVIGIYPLLEDDTTYFLAFDFDKDGWVEDAACLRAVCNEVGLPIAVERSRSGNGAHAWLFFEGRVAAYKARKLGTGLLTLAMQRQKGLKFYSYDRLFPNQDKMPSGGFGNLIALPLQGWARKAGNSVFLDENFTPYPDQWAYLYSIKKLSEQTLGEYIIQICGDHDTGMLTVYEEDGLRKPWAPMNVKPLSKYDFPAVLTITRANLLYAPTEQLTPLAINRIRRLAAFKNPEFMRAQAMRLPTYDKPRVIYAAEEPNGYIALPRGCEEVLINLLNDTKIQYRVQDETNAGRPIRVCFQGELRDEQAPAAHALLAHRTGVLSATTAFGKTVIAAYLIGQRKVNTLVLVHTQALLAQWESALEQFLQIDETLPELPSRRGRKKERSLIGQLGAGKSALSDIVDIAIMQSVILKNEVKPFVKEYGMVIVDECHHISAFSFERILKEATARYVYGLTATPARKDGHHPIIFMQCGDVRYQVDAMEQAFKRPFGHYVLPRFTSFQYKGSDTDKPAITNVYAALCDSPPRNQMIIDDIQSAVDKGRIPLILTQRYAHAVVLHGWLQKSLRAEVFLLTGKATAREKRQELDWLKALPPDKPFAVVATGKYIGEGFDAPRLDTLFLAMPIAWKGTLAQYAGRLHRNYEGKQDVWIFDYVDVRTPVLERMYQKRLRGYAEIGYQAGILESAFAPTPGLLYDTLSFEPVFSADIQSAKKEVLIVSPFVRASRFRKTIPLLSFAQWNGARIVIITRSLENYTAEGAAKIALC